MVNSTSDVESVLNKFDTLKVNKKRRDASIIISMGELLDGYDIVVIGGALIVLTPLFKLSALVTSTLGAITFIGAL